MSEHNESQLNPQIDHKITNYDPANFAFSFKPRKLFEGSWVVRLFVMTEYNPQTFYSGVFPIAMLQNPEISKLNLEVMKTLNMAPHNVVSPIESFSRLDCT